MKFRWYLIKKDRTTLVMETFEEVKVMCEKVDVNPVLLALVTKMIQVVCPLPIVQFP